MDQKDTLLQYLQVMIERRDWHGVADVAMDLRDIEAEERAWEKAMDRAIELVEWHGENTKDLLGELEMSRK